MLKREPNKERRLVTDRRWCSTRRIASIAVEIERRREGERRTGTDRRREK